MNLSAILYGLGTPALFSSRAFLPAFVTAFSLRFGEKLPFLKDLEFLQGTGGEPIWFTHGLTITVLGVLAALEVAATKMPEAQEALEEVDKYAKTGVAVLVYLGVISATDREFVEQTIQQAGLVAPMFGIVIGTVTYYLAGLRAEFMELLIDADDDDDLGIRGMLSWLEDVWAVFGVFILLAYPIIMMVILGVVFGVLKGLQKYVEHQEEKAKIACGKCETSLYPCAVACSNCGTPVPEPRAIGFFGQAKQYPAPDAADHPFRLAEKKRCPVCATRLKEKEVRQTCPECGHELFKDRAFGEQYMSRVTGRLPMTLLVCALLSLVPVLGLIPGVIYYRFSLVGPFRRYLPFGKRLLLKWGLRLLFLVMALGQLIPVAGIAAIPIMALVSYLAYRSAFAAKVGEG